MTDHPIKADKITQSGARQSGLAFLFLFQISILSISESSEDRLGWGDAASYLDSTVYGFSFITANVLLPPHLDPPGAFLPRPRLPMHAPINKQSYKKRREFPTRPPTKKELR
jgi:hypothetical protein